MATGSEMRQEKARLLAEEFGGAGVDQRRCTFVSGGDLCAATVERTVVGLRLVETSDRMVGDAGEHVGEPGLGSTSLSLAVTIRL